MDWVRSSLVSPARNPTSSSAPWLLGSRLQSGFRKILSEGLGPGGIFDAPARALPCRTLLKRVHTNGVHLLKRPGAWRRPSGSDGEHAYEWPLLRLRERLQG